MTYAYRYSATEQYLVCRRRFKYDYVWEIEPDYSGERPVGLSDVGSAFHAGMEGLYKCKDGRRRMEAYIRLHGLSGKLVKINTSMKDAATVARECYTRYDAWRQYSDYDNGRVPVLIEQRLQMEILPGVFISGAMDRVDEDEYGQLHVVDYKTVGRYDQYLKYSDMNRQGLTYCALVEAALGRPVVSFTLLQVHRSPPKSNPQPVNPITEFFSDQQKESHLKHLADTASEMVALAKGKLPATPHPSDVCGYCQFKDLCLSEDADPDNFKEYLNVNFRKKQ